MIQLYTYVRTCYLTQRNGGPALSLEIRPVPVFLYEDAVELREQTFGLIDRVDELRVIGDEVDRLLEKECRSTQDWNALYELTRAAHDARFKMCNNLEALYGLQEKFWPRRD